MPVTSSKTQARCVSVRRANMSWSTISFAAKSISILSNEETHPDMTIRRPDGSWIFHFVNVVDDIEMKISHVIRGEDHLSNTPKHIELYRALGATPPRFAHIPLILNKDGSKMSKRDQGASVDYYIKRRFSAGGRPQLSLPARLVAERQSRENADRRDRQDFRSQQCRAQSRHVRSRQIALAERRICARVAATIGFTSWRRSACELSGVKFENFSG